MFAECSEAYSFALHCRMPHVRRALRDHKADPIVFLKYLENCVFLGVWWRNVGGFRQCHTLPLGLVRRVELILKTRGLEKFRDPLQVV